MKLNQKTMEQFMCDFFKCDDVVEINAIYLQYRLRDLIASERLLSATTKDYKMKLERAEIKIQSLTYENEMNRSSSYAIYRINT